MQHLPPSLLLAALLTVELLSSPQSPHPSLQKHSHLWFGAYAKIVNVTVDDTSPEIVYSPANSWHTSTIPCSSCLSPSRNLAFQGSWHDGTHIIPTVDDDDIGNQEVQNLSPSNSVSPFPIPSVTSTNAEDDDGDDDDRGGGTDSHHRGKGKREPRWRVEGRSHRGRSSRSDLDENPFFTPNLDNDDEGFIDQPVVALFNFTGSAVYVFALVPLFAAPANTTPTFVNLTYTLDGQPAGNFNHSGTQTPTSPDPSPDAYQQSVLVFEKSGLSEGPHALKMGVGPDSVFLLDFIVYSQDDRFSNGGNGTQNTVSTTGSVSPVSTASGSTGTGLPGSRESSSENRSHNIATFAGAVGGSVGLLALLSLSLAFSIYRRRVLSRRRDRRNRAARTRASNASIADSFHTDASEDGPPMQGPAPFVPRYFPGTVPAAPPAYSPSATTADATTALLSSPSPVSSPLPSTVWTSGALIIPADGDTSYADRPPPTPPPMDDGYFSPPPPFPIAVATPIPAILARFSNMPSTSTAPSSVPLIPPPPPPFQLAPSPPLSRRASQRSTNPQTEQTIGVGGNPSVMPNVEMSSDRPPSSASQVPPLIPPPFEVLQAQREAQEHHRGGSTNILL